MVTVTINGKKQDREFQNMAQALSFVSQSGECLNASRLEIAALAPSIKPAAEKKPESKEKQEAAGV